MKILAESINLSYNSKKILQDVRLTLDNKEFLGIIGPNGSGKSSFLKCIYRVVNPNSGVIYLDGKPLDEISYRETALKMAVVSQHNPCSFDFSVLDMVLLGRTPHKRFLENNNEKDINIAKSALENVGLLNLANRKFFTLSGGEQQRMILARALTQDTECLLLDEPTNHLDIKYQLQIMDIVKKTGKTVVAVVHDLNIAAMYCDRIIAMKEGEVVGCGTPEDLLTEKFIYDLYGVRAVVSNDLGIISIRYMPNYLVK